MNKFFPVWILALILIFSFDVSTVFAYPTLQLDIGGGSYNDDSETIMSDNNSFTLYSYLIPNSKNKIDDYYFISAALIKDDDEHMDQGAVNAGSFTINYSGGFVTPLPGNHDNTILVTSEMTYGVPPLETVATQLFDSGDLSKHCIFPTYFAEFGFQFSPTNKTAVYNTADDTGMGLSSITSGWMYYSAFTIDTSLLAPGYSLHFDLYNKKAKNCITGQDCDITQFAPFSHDAQSSPSSVPEPATLILLGAGFIGLGVIKRYIS